MEDKIITPKLTILIPTRNRAKYLKICLNRIIRSIKFGNIKDGDVEILVVDNFSKDETKLIVDKFISKHNFVRYFHHLKPYSCAEESILHSLSKAEGEYVWTFGDDDYMNFSAIGIMMNIIRDNKYKLIVVNTDWIVNRKRRSFISFSKKDNIEYIEYSCGSKLFSDLGFMHITTGLPLLCFKKNEFDNLYFKKAVDISSIYSFSFSLMASFYKSMCLFIAKPLVIMTENKINDEYSRLSHLAISNKHLPRYYWSSGIIGQISLLSSKTNIDLGYFLMYREVIVDRVFYKNFELYVLEYVISFLIEDLKNNNSKYFLLRKKKNINNDLKVFLQIFDDQIIGAFGLNDIKVQLTKIKNYTNKNIFFFLFTIFKIKKLIKNLKLPELRAQINKFNITYRNPKNKIDIQHNLKLFHGKIKEFK